jgi:primase-polymerase (primpol)-like protein
MSTQVTQASQSTLPNGFVLPPALSALAAYHQFIVYKLTPSKSRPGKQDKLPMDWRVGLTHDAQDPAIWMDVETAAGMALAYGDGHGVGFVFTPQDPFWFIDIDDCITDGDRSPTAQALTQRFDGAAVEISASGRGLHVIGKGRAPTPRKIKYAHYFDLYTEKRFVALTGTEAFGDAATYHDAALAQLVNNYLAPDANVVATEWTTVPDASEVFKVTMLL